MGKIRSSNRSKEQPTLNGIMLIKSATNSLKKNSKINPLTKTFGFTTVVLYGIKNWTLNKIKSKELINSSNLNLIRIAKCAEPKKDIVLNVVIHLATTVSISSAEKEQISILMILKAILVIIFVQNIHL